ncbi:zinc metallochaperone AztD [Isoptericola halotolerans]|uniref:DNA-binding beta-propeller fold protein YncE n=1 Tax=Isoptericola halotolerans TaxID=300560 RepID=A0ABX2A6K6_9MICO|nr:zinc metallochaperone AztD [Isoptericola halotolerans]NOV98453.1 DNA-binding beta-propeller fold protein YncE [Isoptericola halotolerans]
MKLRSRAATALALALPLALVAACGTDSDEPAAEPTESAPAADETTDEPATEVQGRSPRLAVTYDGGIKVLDAQTLEEVADIELAGFNRLNPAGDGQHVLVSTTGGFQVLDTGTYGQGHGDHYHYFTKSPQLTDVVYAAETPGHAVVHDGVTALFDDGTGLIQLVDSDEIATQEGVEEVQLAEAHHGVAVPLSDGSLLVTEGNEDERTGIRVLDADGEEIAASDECPGVHGEAVAQGEAVVVGCTDGALIYADGEITKVETPDEYSRIGNQAGSETSPIMLGDYKTDPDADLERPTTVSLIDTRDASLELVELPGSYTFRSLARGDDGEALVLTTDGSLQVIDPETAEITASIPVVDEWEEPEEWQEPRPAVFTLDGSVYVTDPANNAVHAVDIIDGEVWATGELDVAPNEISGALGEPPAEHDHGHEDEAHEDEAHEDEDHEDHDHGDEDHDHGDEDHDHDH